MSEVKTVVQSRGKSSRALVRFWHFFLPTRNELTIKRKKYKKKKKKCELQPHTNMHVAPFYFALRPSFSPINYFINYVASTSQD